MRIKCFTCGKGAWVREDDFNHMDLYCPECDEPLEECCAHKAGCQECQK